MCTFPSRFDLFQVYRSFKHPFTLLITIVMFVHDRLTNFCRAGVFAQPFFPILPAKQIGLFSRYGTNDGVTGPDVAPRVSGGYQLVIASATSPALSSMMTHNLLFSSLWI
jgi:hypothetical protein